MEDNLVSSAVLNLQRMYQRRSIILQNLVFVTTENVCGNFFVVDLGNDPGVQKSILDVLLRLKGMLVMTSDLGLDIQRHAFLPKTIHRQEMERKVRRHGCDEKGLGRR